jgi:hypothetical protein
MEDTDLSIQDTTYNSHLSIGDTVYNSYRGHCTQQSPVYNRHTILDWDTTSLNSTPLQNKTCIQQLPGWVSRVALTYQMQMNTEAVVYSGMRTTPLFQQLGTDWTWTSITPQPPEHREKQLYLSPHASSLIESFSSLPPREENASLNTQTVSLSTRTHTHTHTSLSY